MRYFSVKDLIKITRQINKYELEKKFIKFLVYNQKYHGSKLFYILPSDVYKKMRRSSSISRFQSRCLITRTKKGVYRKFRLSHMKIKELGLLGQLNGLRKASW